MDDAVERAARALIARAYPDHDADFYNDHWPEYAGDAQAVLASAQRLEPGRDASPQA
jgi:hypothetical protein